MRTIVAVSLAAALAAASLAAAAPADAAYKAKVSKGTLKITGNGAGDKLALRLQKGNKNVLVVDVKANGTADFSFARSAFKRIVVNAGAGNDTVSIVETRGAFTNTEKTTLNGGAGKDRLVGGRFAETFAGNRGDDTISGRKGNDRVLWTAGEGNDKIDGEAGADLLTAQGIRGRRHVPHRAGRRSRRAHGRERKSSTSARSSASSRTAAAQATSSRARPASPG